MLQLGTLITFSVHSIPACIPPYAGLMLGPHPMHYSSIGSTPRVDETILNFTGIIRYPAQAWIDTSG